MQTVLERCVREQRSSGATGRWWNRVGAYEAAVATVGALLLVGCGGGSKNAPGPGPAAAMGPMPVAALRVEPTDVALTGQWVGTLDGNVNAQIQPQVSGYLIRQTYREGSHVSKGQVLFEIDPRPFEAALQQAEGQLGQAEGQLGQAKAQQGLAQINVNRDAPLAAQHAIATSQLDNDKQQAAQSGAGVSSAQAAIATARAQVSTAKLNLGFTHVRSLISGIAGQAAMQVGNLVTPQSVLTSVSQLDPIKVYFSISDSEYLELVRQAKAQGGDLLRGSAHVPLTLTLSDGTVFPHKGKIIFVDRQMNQQTGAIRIAATFPNPGDVLRPGEFARVTADTQVRHDVLLVPQEAVQELQGIEQVDTVGPGNKVHVVNVTLGSQYGPYWIVDSGLAPGTEVITDNLQKLREGAPVKPHPAASPKMPTAPMTSAAGR